jgi:hypothetical protein
MHRNNRPIVSPQSFPYIPTFKQVSVALTKALPHTHDSYEFTVRHQCRKKTRERKRVFRKKNYSAALIFTRHRRADVALGGLVVSVLATGPQGSRVQTRPRTMDFKGDKIRTMPSFGGEVKPSVPCRRFTAF